MYDEKPTNQLKDLKNKYEANYKKDLSAEKNEVLPFCSLFLGNQLG